MHTWTASLVSARLCEAGRPKTRARRRAPTRPGRRVRRWRVCMRVTGARAPARRAPRASQPNVANVLLSASFTVGAPGPVAAGDRLEPRNQARNVLAISLEGLAELRAQKASPRAERSSRRPRPSRPSEPPSSALRAARRVLAGEGDRKAGGRHEVRRGRAGCERSRRVRRSRARVRSRRRRASLRRSNRRPSSAAARRRSRAAARARCSARSASRTQQDHRRQRSAAGRDS